MLLAINIIANKANKTIAFMFDRAIVIFIDSWSLAFVTAMAREIRFLFVCSAVLEQGGQTFFLIKNGCSYNLGVVKSESGRD